MTAENILKTIKDKEIEFVDLRFTDPRGKLQHLTQDVSTVDAEFLDGSESQLNFYRTKNARADRRISIRGIKKQASVGDTLAITSKVNKKGETILIINTTENVSYQHLAQG